jgi:outer membrane beta-barrel protein
MKKKYLTLVSITLAIVAFSPGVLRAEDKKPNEETIGNLTKDGIDVVQSRIFRKAYRHEFSIDGGVIPNNTFLFYEAASAKYAYHFSEGLAFEAAYFRGFNQNKPILDDLAAIECPSANSDLDGDGNTEADTNGDGNPNCPVTLRAQPDPMKNAYFGSLIWSPIYGKFAIFSKKIFHFDIFLSAGAGLFDNERSNRFAFSVGTGIKIFMNEWMATKVEFRNITVRESAPFSNIVNNRLFTLGVSFFFPTKVK